MTLRDQLTEMQRQAMLADLVTALPSSEIPHHLRGGLVRYFSDGILPGGFLQAVLCNDLTETVMRAAAPSALYASSQIITFLLAYAPKDAWGNRERVLAWTTTPDRLEV